MQPEGSSLCLFLSCSWALIWGGGDFHTSLYYGHHLSDDASESQRGSCLPVGPAGAQGGSLCIRLGPQSTVASHLLIPSDLLPFPCFLPGVSASLTICVASRPESSLFQIQPVCHCPLHLLNLYTYWSVVLIMYPRLASRSWRFSCLCLLSVGITDTHRHHTWLDLLIFRVPLLLTSPSGLSATAERAEIVN